MERERGIPGGARSPLTRRYAVTTPLEGPAVGIAWYRRTAAPEPETVRDLDRQEEAARKAAEAERTAEAERLEALRKLAKPVAISLLEPSLPSTLRGMVARVGTLGGTVEVVNGRVVVSLPPGEFGREKFGVRIARWLYRAEAELLAVRKTDGPVDPAKVPDRPLLPSGRLVP